MGFRDLIELGQPYSDFDILLLPSVLLELLPKSKGLILETFSQFVMKIYQLHLVLC